MMATGLRFLRTVRYVPPRALLWRVRTRVMGLFYRSPLFGIRSLSVHTAPEVAFIGPLLVPGRRDEGEIMAQGIFRLAGKAVTLRLPDDSGRADGRGMVWFPKGVSALGHFTLHYHEWLADLRACGNHELARRLVGDWLMQFGGTYHPVAWHPYPTSLRLVAWLTHGAWLLDDADEDFADALKLSLTRQLLHVGRNLERDLGGNHLLKDLKALIYGAVSVDGQRETLAGALAMFLRELRTQILPDGGHYERTPLYMAQVLRDVLEVRAVLRKAHGGAPAVLDDVVRHLGTALATLTHGDGKLALFNDGAEMEADGVGALLRLSGADDPVAVLPQTGYARMQRGKSLVLMDAGPVGPDENPGHAHADTLSLEFSVGAERVVVNQGTYAYQDKLRQAFRGTAAHSTVCVDNQNSAEVWGGFRVGRRPQVVRLDVKGADGGDMVVVGSHDGYRSLGVRHARKLVMAADGSRLRGEDELRFEPTGWAWVGQILGLRVPPQRAVAHFHLHPDVNARLVTETEAELTTASGMVWTLKAKQGRFDMKESRYAPQFGQWVPTKQIVLNGRFAKGECRLEWDFERVRKG